MVTFCFNPSAKRESLKEFNDRVQEYCADNHVVEINAHAAGKYLCLNTVPVEEDPEWDYDDDGVCQPREVIIPVVLPLDSADDDWEEQLELMTQRENNKKGAGFLKRKVVDQHIIQNGSDSAKAWAVAIVVVNLVVGPDLPEEEDNDGDNNDEDNNDDDGGDDDNGDPNQGAEMLQVGFVPGKVP
jgi:hypothetical protein